MTGYRIKQTVFIVIGIAAGLWLGNFWWHIVTADKAKELVESKKKDFPAMTPEEYDLVIKEVTKKVEAQWSEYTPMNLLGYLMMYGIPIFCGIGLGVWLAEDTGGEKDRSQ